jgi:hypothetical protein
MKMRLDRKTSIGSLYEITVGDASALACHSFLILEAANVLNHGIAQAEIEGAISEFAQITGIASD